MDVFTAVIGFVVSFVGLTLVFGVVLGLAVKLFARSLRLTRSLLIGLRSAAGGALVFALYSAVQPHLQLPDTVASFAGLLMLGVIGTLIAVQLRAQGLQRAGWVGAGAVLILVMLTTLPVVLYFWK
jgi:Na+-translocating ferredoxin:NAD+ oxidoreductase RnfA subunit